MKEINITELYGGGWRSADRDALRWEHGLTEDELDALCEELDDIAKLQPYTWEEYTDYYEVFADGYMALRLMKSGSTDEDERCTLDECKDLGELIGSWDLESSADSDSEVFGFLNK